VIFVKHTINICAQQRSERCHQPTISDEQILPSHGCRYIISNSALFLKLETLKTTGERLEEEAKAQYEGQKQASYLCALNKVREQGNQDDTISPVSRTPVFCKFGSNKTASSINL
jgi:hypothetical protein